MIFKQGRIGLTAVIVSGAVIVHAAAEPQELHERQLINDYPTSARVDYVFGCMAANGQTRQALENCSCSIDVVATILPYDKYVQAETVLSVRRVGGEKVAMFNSSPEMRKLVADLRRAQAEAEFRCF